MVDFPKLKVKTAEKIAEKEGYPTWSRGFSKTEWYSKESVRVWAKAMAEPLKDALTRRTQGFPADSKNCNCQTCRVFRITIKQLERMVGGERDG